MVKTLFCAIIITKVTNYKFGHNLHCINVTSCRGNRTKVTAITHLPSVIGNSRKFFFYLESLLAVRVVTIYVTKFVIIIRIVQLIRIERLSSDYLLSNPDILLTQYKSLKIIVFNGD